MVKEFRPGRRYRHRSFLDVDMVPGAEFFLYTGRLEGVVRWWHRSLGAYIPDSMRVDRVRVRPEDLGNWTEVSG